MVYLWEADFLFGTVGPTVGVHRSVKRPEIAPLEPSEIDSPLGLHERPWNLLRLPFGTSW